MTAKSIPARKVSLEDITSTVRGLLTGRRNAHGTFTLATTPATSTTVKEQNSVDGTNIVWTATTANAANIARTADFYIVADNGQFVVNHGATANADCTFSYSVQG